MRIRAPRKAPVGESPGSTVAATPIPVPAPALPAPALPAPALPAPALLALARTGGNRAVLRLLNGANAPAGGETTSAAAAFARATAGPAQPVPMRSEMEQAFEADFGGVQAHLGDPAAREGLDLLGARAATYGSTVVFREADPGRELIAHELAHVLQQGGGTGLPGVGVAVSRPDSREERDAQAAARLVGGGASVMGADGPDGGGQILREPGDPVADQSQVPPTDEAAAKVQHALGSGSASEVRGLGSAALATTTPAQRAGLAKILTDQMWTDKADEQATMALIRLRGEHAVVLAHLDALGYREKLLASIDDEALQAELQGLVGVAVTGGTGPVAAALTSRRSEDVQKIPYADLRTVARQQRIGLLQIMLELSGSNAAEEGRILDILESTGGGLAAVIADVKALGLKQRLFDHVDDDGAKQRLTSLLTPLRDAELDADLVVFNRGFWGNVGEGLARGWDSAVQNFSIGALVMGMLQPIIHPIDTIAKHIDDAEQAVKEPSADRIVALLRDIFGTLGMWLLVAAGVVAAVGLAVSAGVITLPAGIAIEGVAAALLTAATWCGVAFIALVVIKLLLDTSEAGAATTAQEHQTESHQIGEDITALGVIAVLAGLLKALGRTIKGLRGSTEDPAKADPAELARQAQEAKDSQAKAAEEANKLKDSADKKQGSQRAGFKEDVYDSADPARTPEEWTFTDTVTEPSGGGDLRVAETQFEAPNGAKGMGRRALNTKTGELEMQEIKVPPEARWIGTETPLVEGRGTPMAAYVSMRLMKLLGVASGSLKTVLIKNIWNLQAVLELHKLGGKDGAVAETNSVTSQETALTQSGHRITRARVKPGTGREASLKELLDYWETEQESLKTPNPEIVKQHNEILKKFGLTREEAVSKKFFWDYDIEVFLEPLQGPPPSTGGLPGVVPVQVPDQKDGG